MSNRVSVGMDVGHKLLFLPMVTTFLIAPSATSLLAVLILCDYVGEKLCFPLIVIISCYFAQLNHWFLDSIGLGLQRQGLDM